MSSLASLGLTLMLVTVGFLAARQSSVSALDSDKDADKINGCLAEVEAKMDSSVEVPEGVTKLAADIRAMNPHLEQLTLTQLMSNTSADLDIHRAGLVDDDDLQPLVVACSEFVRTFFQVMNSTECEAALFEVAMPRADGYADFAAKHTRIDEAIGYSLTCLTLRQPKPFAGLDTETVEKCLSQVESKIVDLTIPDDIKKLAADIVALDPSLKGMRLSSAVSKGSEHLDLPKLFADPSQLKSLEQTCAAFMKELFGILTLTDCGHNIFQLIQPQGEEFEALIAKHSKVDDLVGMALSCLALLDPTPEATEPDAAVDSPPPPPPSPSVAANAADGSSADENRAEL